MKKLLLFIIVVTACTGLLAQVTQLNSNQSLRVHFPLNDNKGLLISDIDSSMWVTDGTPAGTVKLATDLYYRASGGLLNGKYYFSATSPATGKELYVTDGTPAGTMLVKDINPGIAGSDPYQGFALLNGYLYFTASTPAEGRELWRTDGTTSGTTLVKDILPGTAGSNSGTGYNLFSNGSYLLFGALTSGGDVELWKSDGTAAGTQLLKDINTFPGKGSKPDYFNKYGNIVLFMANDSTHGTEIWKTDGTDVGTVLLKDIYPGTGSSITYTYFKEINGKLLFNADNGTNGGELWSTDGTEANTNMVMDIFPGSYSSYVTTYNAVSISNTKLLFTATNYLNGYELWQTDGTAAGTSLLKDIDPGTNNSTPYFLLAYEVNYGNLSFTNPLFQGNRIFFQATTVANGTELWITDGAPSGTQMVKELNPAAGNGINAPSFFYTTNHLFFAGDDGVNGLELWKTDGTNAGTVRVSDINVGASSAEVLLGMVVNNNLVFQATDVDALTKDFYRFDGVVSVLPISLSDFGISLNKGDVVLQWTTSCEVNSKNFTVQRSRNGKDFISIGVVNASGNSCDKKAYGFTDADAAKLPASNVYYRLLLTDIDGKKDYSKIISLRLNGKQEWALKLLQNPVVNELKILQTDATGNTHFSLKDSKGNSLNIAKTLGNGQMSIDVSSLTPGIYILAAQNGNERKAVKFVKL